MRFLSHSPWGLRMAVFALAACGDDDGDVTGDLDLAVCEERNRDSRCVCDRPEGESTAEGFLGVPGANACESRERCIVEPGEARGACFPSQDLCLPDRYEVVSQRKELPSKDCSGREVCLVQPRGAWFGRCEPPDMPPEDNNKNDDEPDAGKGGGTDAPSMDAGVEPDDAGSSGGGMDATTSPDASTVSDAATASDAAPASDAGAPSGSIAAATITVLPHPGKDYRCTGTAISLDGTVVVGQCAPLDNQTPGAVHVWKNAGAPGTLQVLDAQAGGCGATAMSGDAKVIAGLCASQTDGGVINVPVIWTNGGSAQVVPFPWSGEYLASSRIGAINRDGTLKAASGGSFDSAPTSVYIEGGTTYIFPSTTTAEQSVVTDMSTDGSIVAGVKYSATFPSQHVFLWSKAGGVSEPINLELFGNTVLSGDGKVVYGSNNTNSQGFRWTSAAGVVPLVSLGEPKATNEDGTIVVTKSGSLALVFDHDELLSLTDLLTAGGVVSEDLIGPEFVALSSDGMTALVNGYVSGGVEGAAVVHFAKK